MIDYYEIDMINALQQPPPPAPSLDPTCRTLTFVLLIPLQYAPFLPLLRPVRWDRL